MMCGAAGPPPLGPSASPPPPLTRTWRPPPPSSPPSPVVSGAPTPRGEAAFEGGGVPCSHRVRPGPTGLPPVPRSLEVDFSVPYFLDTMLAADPFRGTEPQFGKVSNISPHILKF